jgi:uncharacterized membrane-anchored protein YjiN (DUF445 family)
LSKQIYGDKPFDFTSLAEEAPMEFNQIRQLEIPKDAKKRLQFQKHILTSDTNLPKKADKVKSTMKERAQRSLALGEVPETFDHLTNKMGGVKDPLQEIL